jgi:hypothetical protein
VSGEEGGTGLSDYSIVKDQLLFRRRYVLWDGGGSRIRRKQYPQRPAPIPPKSVYVFWVGGQEGGSRIPMGLITFKQVEYQAKLFFRLRHFYSWLSILVEPLHKV